MGKDEYEASRSYREAMRVIGEPEDFRREEEIIDVFHELCRQVEKTFYRQIAERN